MSKLCEKCGSIKREVNNSLGLEKIKVYHTTSYRPQLLEFPLFAKGKRQWLGDGYYFWQDYQFAEWWGNNLRNREGEYDIYEATLEYKKEELIDTVFNEEDYYNFVKKLEDFSKKYQKKFRKKPNLEDFNLFIECFKERFDFWGQIKIIRFQDVPQSNLHLEINDYYYKKRIQIRVNEKNIICNFAFLKTNECI